MEATNVSTKSPSTNEMLCSYLSTVSHGIYKLGRKKIYHSKHSKECSLWIELGKEKIKLDKSL